MTGTGRLKSSKLQSSGFRIPPAHSNGVSFYRRHKELHYGRGAFGRGDPAEDAVIHRVATAVSDIGVSVEPRNQQRQGRTVNGPLCLLPCLRQRLRNLVCMFDEELCTWVCMRS